MEKQIVFKGIKGFTLNLQLKLKSPGINWVMGENGAGKSTLLKILTGVISYPLGDEFQRYQLGTEGNACLLSGGAYFAQLTLDDHFRLLATALEPAKVEYDHCIDQWQLDHFRNTKMGKLSTGQLHRALLAMVTMGEPTTVILDEPEKTLDDSGHFQLRAAIQKWRQSGRSVVISTHGNQAISPVDHIILLRQGHELFSGSVAHLLESFGQESYGPIIYLKKLLDP